ncbi:MAG: hypothetical protein CMJ18_21065, partial [Phycisphaeraceae bacterium]|nr:hypothetical protein [Phycisphaeraceae bacterium]
MSESIRHRGSTIENYSPWLHRAAVLYVILTFIVIISGGNVTSRGAGMSVPDGFTVYGYFLWAFPIDRWVGNIFHEHVHRLVGSVIGITALAVAVWTAIVERRRTVRMIAFVAALMVLVQGILGALRVNQISTTLAVVHGVHAQMILCMTVWLP